MSAGFTTTFVMSKTLSRTASSRPFLVNHSSSRSSKIHPKEPVKARTNLLSCTMVVHQCYIKKDTAFVSGLLSYIFMTHL